MPDWRGTAAALRRLLRSGDGGFGSVCHLEQHQWPALDQVLGEVLLHGAANGTAPRPPLGPPLLQRGDVAAPAARGGLAAGCQHGRGGVGLFSSCLAPHHTGGGRQPWQEGLALALLCAWLALVAYNIFFAARRRGGHRAEAPASEAHAAAAGAGEQAPRRPPPKSGCQGAARCDIWDATKFLLMAGVIFFHCAFYLSAEDLRDWTVSRAALRPVVPCFIFVSGVFGASVSLNALLKALFYPWPCVLVIGAILAARSLDERLAAATAGFNGFAFWYLWCLCFWRLAVSPVMHVGNRKLGVPVVFLLLALQLLAHALLSTAGSLGGPWNDVWRCFLFYAPVFAAGQLLEPSFWRDTFAEGRRAAGTAAASVAFVVLWYLLLAASPEFGRWNTAYCINEETCSMGNYGIPHDVLHEPISEAGLCENVAMFALRLGIVLAYLGVLGAGLHCLGAACPGLLSCAAGWGERSVFAYVLHHLWLELIVAAGGRDMLDAAPAAWRPAACFALALQATVVLSSEGTASLARWLVIPPWL